MAVIASESYTVQVSDTRNDAQRTKAGKKITIRII